MDSIISVIIEFTVNIYHFKYLCHLWPTFFFFTLLFNSYFLLVIDFQFWYTYFFYQFFENVVYNNLVQEKIKVYDHPKGAGRLYNLALCFKDTTGVATPSGSN